MAAVDDYDEEIISSLAEKLVCISEKDLEDELSKTYCQQMKSCQVVMKIMATKKELLKKPMNWFQLTIGLSIQ